MDWRSYDPKHCETTSNFSPSSSPSSTPKSNWSSATIAQTREECEGRRRRRGFRFFSWWDRKSKKMTVLTAPRTFMSPRIDVDASNSADLSRQVSLTTIHLSFSHSRCLIHDAVRRLVFIVSGYLCPSHTHILSAVFLKDAGTHTHKNVDSISTYPLIQQLTSVCSLDKASPTYSHGSQKGVHFLLPYL